MTEAFLHYVWKNQLFDKSGLRTTCGSPVTVIHAGEHNHHSGPDFFNARIRIAETYWAGTVEIHMQSSEWRKHRHHEDAAYDNCILHVVLKKDAEVFNTKGSRIFCLELLGLVPVGAWNNYLNLIGTDRWIPCSHRIREVDGLVVKNWLRSLASERLVRRSDEFLVLLERNESDLELTMFQFMCTGFGFQVNNLPFSVLSRMIPWQLIQRNRNNLLQVEAIMFGCSGFLNKELDDDYYNKLRSEFSFFRNAYKLEQLEVSNWKFMRLRPGNFPTVRIAQLSALLVKSENLFSSILQLKDWASGKEFFNIHASSYWDRYYNFGKRSSSLVKSLGQDSIANLFINVIVPSMFSYGILNSLPKYKERAMVLLEQVPPERNSLMNSWSGIGIQAHSALESQALLELKKRYCSEKKCLTCRIGKELINSLP